MKIIENVIWTEGTLLSQQHFQQWDQYHKHQYSTMHSLGVPQGWGVVSLEVEPESLVNGRFQVASCQVIFAEVGLVQYSVTNDQPLSCELTAELGKNAAVYLCLSASGTVSDVSGYPQSAQLATWRADYRELNDQYDINRQHEVLLAKPNLQLICTEQLPEHCHSIKIAEVVNRGGGAYQLVETFVPTVVQLKASAYLQQILRQQLELAVAKNRILQQQQQTVNSEAVDVGASNVQRYLLLNAFNRAKLRLRYLQQNLESSPQQLFMALSELAGELQIFNEQTEMSDVAVYRHQDLTQSFTELNDYLCKLIETVMPERLPEIHLQKRSDSLYVADNIDSRVLHKAGLYLAVHFQADNDDWIEHFARQIKVGSEQAMQSIITSALPGVKLLHTQRPPSSLLVKPGYEYFYLEPNGDFWEQIKQEQTLAMFVSHDFVAVEIELVSS